MFMKACSSSHMLFVTIVDVNISLNGLALQICNKSFPPGFLCKLCINASLLYTFNPYLCSELFHPY